MQISPKNLRRPALYGLLVVALVGSAPFLTQGCREIQVYDQETGQLRNATPAEAADVIAAGGEVAKDVMTAVGRPDWWPFADIAVRLAVLIYAIRFGRPLTPTPTAAPTEGKH